MSLPEFNTLSEAKEYLRENFDKGTKCPCCGQFVKLYKRSITSGQAHGLIMFYRYSEEHPEEFIHVSNFDFTAFRGGDFAKLRYWGFIEQAENDDPSKRDSGMWSITDKGRQFVRNERTVPRQVHLYDGQRVGWSEDRVSIKDALKNKFNYEELMSY